MGFIRSSQPTRGIDVIPVCSLTTFNGFIPSLFFFLGPRRTLSRHLGRSVMVGSHAASLATTDSRGSVKDYPAIGLLESERTRLWLSFSQQSPHQASPRVSPEHDGVANAQQPNKPVPLRGVAVSRAFTLDPYRDTTPALPVPLPSSERRTHVL